MSAQTLLRKSHDKLVIENQNLKDSLSRAYEEIQRLQFENGKLEQSSQRSLMRENENLKRKISEAKREIETQAGLMSKASRFLRYFPDYSKIDFN